MRGAYREPAWLQPGLPACASTPAARIGTIQRMVTRSSHAALPSRRPSAPRVRRAASLVGLLVLAFLLPLVGCGGPRPDAAYSSRVRDAILPTTLRCDADDPIARADAAETIRRTQPLLRATLGEPSAARSIVWQLSPDHLDRFLARLDRRRSRFDNTGAATLVGRSKPEVFLERPMRTATPEGDATQRLHAEFVLAHEYTHAWTSGDASTMAASQLEEGLANWIGLVAVEDRSLEGVRYDGPQRIALAMTRLTDRAGTPITVESILRARGEEAYVFGTAFFLWVADETSDLTAFGRVARRAISLFGMRTNDLQPHLTADASNPASDAGTDAPKGPVIPKGQAIEDRFRRWLDRTDRAARTWWAPLGYFAVGVHTDGRVLLAEDGAIVAMSFGDPAALPAEAAELDRLKGLPPFDRVVEVEISVRGGDAIIDPTFQHESIRVGVAVVSGGASQSPGVRLADGRPLRLRVEGPDVVGFVDDAPIARWPGAACQVFAVASRGILSDGRLPVVEIRRRPSEPLK